MSRAETPRASVNLNTCHCAPVGLAHQGFLRFLGIGQEGETQHHMGRLREYSRQIVKQLATSLDKPAGDSFVGLFMLNQPEASPEFLADLVLNFLIAGRDTTAQAMSWCLFLLMQHPAVEQRLFEEVQAVTGGKQVTYEQLASLTYTDAVLRESLRLHPSVPLDPKYNTEAISLPDGTFLPRDTMLVYNSYRPIQGNLGPRCLRLSS